MTVQFKKLEEFIKEREASQKVQSEMQGRLNDANAKYEQKKAEYEATITAAALEGKDMTAKLDKLDEEIKEAKAAVERRQKEIQIYLAANPLIKIKPEEVVASFNSEVMPEFRKVRFDAVLTRLLIAKIEYEQAELDYQKAVEEFEDIRDKGRGALGEEYFYKFNSIRFGTKDSRSKYLITQNDLTDLGRGRQMTSIQYVDREELMND